MAYMQCITVYALFCNSYSKQIVLLMLLVLRCSSNKLYSRLLAAKAIISADSAQCWFSVAIYLTDLHLCSWFFLLVIKVCNVIWDQDKIKQCWDILLLTYYLSGPEILSGVEQARLAATLSWVCSFGAPPLLRNLKCWCVFN